MDPKELRGLMEAYSEVYAPQEVDEEMKPLPKEKMERQAMKAYKKERSAIDRRDDPEANRQMQRRIAMQSPASRRNVLQNKKMGEEVQQIDVDEAVKGASRHDTEMRKAASTERKAGIKNRLSPAAGKDNANKMQRDINYFDKLTKKNKNVVGLVSNEEVENYDEGYMPPTQKRADKMMKQVSKLRRTASEKGDFGHPEVEKKFKQSDKVYNFSKLTSDLAKKRDKDAKKSEFNEDIYDIILSHLLDEGYVETLEEAEWLMANVIDEEAIAIVIGEAQVANRDPDKYEREQSKKSAPVRGEKTPMPPRGDKRREDFEKWYAANVR
jgi:hypothetical protein